MTELASLDQRMRLAAEFSDACHGIFAAYLAGVNGLEASLRELVIGQQQKLAIHGRCGNHRYTIEDVRREPVRHELEAGEGNPQQLIFETTIGEFEKNIAHAGPYFRLLGRMAITFRYAAWEDRFRVRFARELGYANKHDFEHDLFGDLGYLRNAAVHNHGRASKDVECKTKTVALRWFREGQEMLLSVERIDVIMGEIRFFCAAFETGQIQWVEPRKKQKGCRCE